LATVIYALNKENMKTRNLILVFIIALFCSKVVSQNIATDTYLQTVNSELNKYLSETYVKGISIAVYDYSTNNIYQYTAGISHEEQVVTKDMLWRIGSNTKTFVSVLMLKLAELKLLSVDDEIGKYLPSYQNVNSSITIRQLLQHQSGLADIYSNNELERLLDSMPSKKWKPTDALKYLPIPISEPGVMNYYSATNYILAALVIEKVTGMTLHKAMCEYITKPLSLNNTFFYAFEERDGILPHAWEGDRDVSDIELTSWSTASGAGGFMISSPLDMAVWYHTLFNGKILSDESFSQFTSFKLWDFDKFYDYVGLGIFKIKRNGYEYYGHGGGVFGFYSFLLYDLETKNSIIVLTTGDFSVAEKLSYIIADVFR